MQCPRALPVNLVLLKSNRVFHGLYTVGRNGIINIKGFNNSNKKLPPVGLDLMQEIITGLRVQCLTNWAKLAFACKSKTFRSWYSHTLLIPTESSKSKNQVVHEQKFKDSLNSTCQFSQLVRHWTPCSSRSRIFLRGVCQLPIWDYFVNFFCQKLYENERIWTPGVNEQWRIQDFPEEGVPTPQGLPTYDFAKFSQKLHEIERIWTPGWCASLAPPLDLPLP